MLTQPIDERLADAKNVLIAGAGGGYDVICGVPIVLALESRGVRTHLASFASTPINDVADAVQLSPSLIEVTAKSSRPSYFPEGWLARWLTVRLQREISVYCFGATGVGPLYEGYQLLIRKLDIDAIIVVDGGVDSLLRGDECALGSPLEDALTLATVSLIDGPERILAVTAFGAERLDRISHAQVLGRIADLTRAGAWLGTDSLTGAQATDFSAGARHVLEHQEGMHNSVVVASMLSAVAGEFGDRAVTAHSANTPPWISPLMALYWYFDLAEVARQNLYLSRLVNTTTFADAAEALGAFMKSRVKRGWEDIPI